MKTRKYVRMIVVLFSLLGDLRNLHSRRGNGQCSDEGYRGCYSGEAMLPSVGWKYSPSLDAEGCPIVPNLLSFLLPLSSPAAEISSSVHTMVLSSIVFNTKGPTIAPMENASIAHRLKQLKWDLSLKTGAAQPWRGIKLGQTL